MTKKDNSNFFIFLCSALLIIADQIIKFYVKGFNCCGFHTEGMFLGQSIPVIGDFIQITFVENEGMAFGISFGAGKIFLSLFSVIASGVLVWYLYKIRTFSIWVRLGVMFILAGAVGNLVDRVFYGMIYGYAPIFWGRVVDFVQVDIPDINFWNIHYTHFPVFNVADSCVTVGVAFLLIFHNRIPSFAELKTKRAEEIDNKEIESDSSVQNTSATDNH